jgi:hypothetical protein
VALDRRGNKNKGPNKCKGREGTALITADKWAIAKSHKINEDEMKDKIINKE